MILLAGLASACDDPLFSALPIPAPTSAGRGYASTTRTREGVDLFGVRLSLESAHSLDAWRDELLRPEHHDEWQAPRFGNERAERVDPDHTWSLVDLAFFFDTVHVRRQVVARSVVVQRGDLFRVCFRAVDPAPFQDRVAAWATDAPWDTHLFGGWDVMPRPGGGTLVAYQWWTLADGVPDAVLGFAAERTLPDLLDAYEAHLAAERR